MSTYTPSPQTLKKYADVLIKYALWSGKGAQQGDVICLTISESAKPFLTYLQQAILESGCHMLLQYSPDGISRDFFSLATEVQLSYMPEIYLRARVQEATHFVGIISESDKHELEGIDPKKIMLRQKAAKFYMDARRAKEDASKLTWTLALYGTPAMAAEVGMTEQEYWEQIERGCFLDEADPISHWRSTTALIEQTRAALSKLPIEWLHVQGADADLHVQIGPGRKWLSGSGRNIPSFEIFTSPDWRGTHGWIQFNQPLYRYGNRMSDVRLVFENGIVTQAHAKANASILQEMIAVENANKIGEFSLTDKRTSRITKFMGETLFDENVGGPFGNTHIAVGMAYRDCYPGDLTTMSETEWEQLGYNDSVVHTDIVSTTDRTVTATLRDGSTRVIYRDGMFQV